MGLRSLEVYSSIFSIAEQSNKFEFFTDTFDEISFEELKDELEEILSLSDITQTHFYHEKLGPRIFETYMKVGSE